MNRRRFLSFLGLAPVAAAVPAVALPKPDNPTDIEKLTVKLSFDTTEMGKMVEEIARYQAKMLAANMRKAKRRGLL